MFPEPQIKPAAAFRSLVLSGRYMLPLLVLAVGLSGFRSASFSLEHLLAGGPPIANTLLITWLMGSFAGPLLLPWLPGNGLAAKGVMTGLLALLIFPATCFFLHIEPLDVLMALLIIPSGSSFLTVVSACRSTGTLLDNCPELMKVTLPVQLALMALAVGIWITARFN